MSETPDSGIPDNPIPEHLPPSRGEHELLHASQPSPEALRTAYGGWLERRGIDPASIPHLTMGQREFDLFRNAPPNYLAYTRQLYEIPGGDQNDCWYALVDVEPGDSSLPHSPELVTVTEAEFGTVIDPDTIAKDFQSPDSDPGPSMPNLPHGAYKTFDIGEIIAKSWKGLNLFATNLMRGKTEDPFSGTEGDIGVRAGEPASDQEDAYVWTRSPFTRSVELTLAFPYDSVCVVRGQRREPANGKSGTMAQIVDPEVVLKIEGEDLEKLQGIYRELYDRPDFALTDQQKRERHELFNHHLAGLISDAAEENRERAAYEAHGQQSSPATLQARERPLP